MSPSVHCRSGAFKGFLCSFRRLNGSAFLVAAGLLAGVKDFSFAGAVQQRDKRELEDSAYAIGYDPGVEAEGVEGDGVDGGGYEEDEGADEVEFNEANKPRFEFVLVLFAGF